MAFSQLYWGDDLARIYPPRPIIFKKVSLDIWPVEDPGDLEYPGDLRYLDMLLGEGLFDPNGAGFANGGVWYGIWFMLTNRDGIDVTVTTIAELTEEIDWSNPVVTVVFGERVGGGRTRVKPSYHSWYEFLGYARTLSGHSFVYVKREEIPTDWVQNEERTWFPPSSN